MTNELSPRAKALIKRLYTPPRAIDRFLGRPRWRADLRVVAELAACGEPAVIRYLAPILAFGSADEMWAAARAIEALITPLRGSDLQGFDELMRRYLTHENAFDQRWRRLSPIELARWAGPARPESLVLRLASFHPSGFVRQEAVRRLGLMADGSEVPYLLLRLTDWVAQIRAAAAEAVADRLTEAYAPCFVQHLDLVLRVQRARRADQGILLQRIFDLLAGTEVRAGMLNLMLTGPRELRRFCFRALTSAGSRTDDVLQAASRSPDPVIRLWSARIAIRTAAPGNLYATAAALLADRSALVRKEALNCLLAAFPEDAGAQCRSALLDPSRSIREAAGTALRRQTGFDLAGFYRDALVTATSTRQLATAIAGLAETGCEADGALLAAYLPHPSPTVRRTAARATMKLGGDRYVDQVAERLGDPSPGVASTAARLLRPYASGIGAAALWPLFHQADSLQTRRRLLPLLAALPKWESIRCLLDATCLQDASLAPALQQYIRRWSHEYNRSQTAPSAAQLAGLAAALSRAEPFLRPADAASIRFAVQTFSRR